MAQMVEPTWWSPARDHSGARTVATLPPGGVYFDPRWSPDDT